MKVRPRPVKHGLSNHVDSNRHDLQPFTTRNELSFDTRSIDEKSQKKIAKHAEWRNYGILCNVGFGDLACKDDKKSSRCYNPKP